MSTPPSPNTLRMLGRSQSMPLPENGGMPDSPTRLKDVASIEDWWSTQILKHRFCVLLFYRGEYSGPMWDFFASIDEGVQEVRALGGEMFIVTPFKIDRKHCQRVNCTIMWDPHNTLAHKYKVTVKEGSKLSPLLKLRSAFKKSSSSPKIPLSRENSRSSDETPNPERCFQLSHPGIVIVSLKRAQQSEHFAKNTTIKNTYDKNESFTVQSLEELLTLHFGLPSPRNSCNTFMSRYY